MSQEEIVNTPLRNVEWLAEFIGVSTKQAYEKIEHKQVPEYCIVRMGRLIRVNEDAIREWADPRKRKQSSAELAS